MITTICIVRHGETDWNREKRFQGREDTDLNERGREQASLIAAHLKKFHWDIILTSPLKRARETAEIIGKECGHPGVTVEDLFIERDYGKASGMTLAEQQSSFAGAVIPGKEDDDSLRDRVMAGMHSIVKHFYGSRIVLVSHGAVINALLKALSHGEVDLGETNIRNTCINRVEYDGGIWDLKEYNSVEYLK